MTTATFTRSATQPNTTIAPATTADSVPKTETTVPTTKSDTVPKPDPTTVTPNVATLTPKIPSVAKATQTEYDTALDNTKAAIDDSLVSNDPNQLKEGDLQALSKLSYDQIYERATRPDAVGKWLSDSISGRLEDVKTRTILNNAFRSYGGDTVRVDGRLVPTAYKELSLHDDAWSSTARSFFNGVTMSWGDELYALGTTNSDEDYNRVLKKFDDKIEQFRGSSPVTAFVAEGVGMVGTSLLAAPISAPLRATAIGAKVASSSGLLATTAKIAASGAAENIVQGAGERVNDKFNLDAVLKDGAIGATLGTTLSAGMKLAPKTIDASRQIMNGLFGTNIGTSATNIANSIAGSLKANGIKQADITKLQMESMAEGKNLSVFGAITLAAPTPDHADRFFKELTDKANKTGDFAVLDLIRTSNINELSTMIADKTLDTAKRITNGDIAEAINEIGSRIDSGKIVAENFEQEANKIIKMLPQAERKQFMQMLKVNPSLIESPEARRMAADSIRGQRSDIGSALGEVRKSISLNSNLSDLDNVLDNFKGLQPMGKSAPKHVLDISIIENALNQSDIIASKAGLWSVKIDPVAGVPSGIMSKPLRGEPIDNLKLNIYNKDPALAAKYGIVPGDTGKEFSMRGEDYSIIKKIDPTVDAILARSIGTRADIVGVQPPEIRGADIVNVMSKMDTEFKSGSINLGVETNKELQSAINDMVSGKNLAVNELSTEYRKLSRATEWTGLDEDSGSLKILNDFLVNPNPTARQTEELADIPKQYLPIVLAKALSIDNITELTRKEGFGTVMRLGEIRKAIDPSFNIDLFKDAVHSVQVNSDSLLDKHRGLVQALDANGLNAGIKGISGLPDKVQKLELSAELLDTEVKRIDNNFKSAMRTFDNFEAGVKNSGLDTPQIAQALEDLKSIKQSNVDAFNSLINDTYESTVLKSMAGVDIKNISDTIKPLEQMLRSEQGKQLIKIGLESRLGRSITDPKQLKAAIEKEISSLNDVVKLSSMYRKIDDLKLVAGEDIDSASLLADAVFKGLRSRGDKNVAGIATYTALEFARTAIRAIRKSNPNLNKKEMMIAVDALSNADPQNPMTRRVMEKFMGQKPSSRSWSEYLTGKEANNILLQLSLYSDN